MISPDILIQDIDAGGWVRFLSLIDSKVMRELAGLPPKVGEKKSRLFVLHEGDKVLKAYHSEKGGVLDGFEWSGVDNLKSLAQKMEADIVIAIERNAMPGIYSKFQANFKIDDDYVKQCLDIYEVVRQENGRGLNFYPEAKLIRIDYDYVRRISKLLISDDGSIVFYLFDGNGIWCSFIVGMRNGNYNLVTSHDALEAKGISIYNWRKDYKKILEAARGIAGKPQLGYFADVRAFARVVRARKPFAAFADERKAKNIIIEPFPILLKTALGAGKFFI